MDKYLLDIVRDRKYWENKRYEIHQKEKKLNGIVAEYDERLEKIATEHKLIIKEAKNEAQEILKKKKPAKCANNLTTLNADSSKTIPLCQSKSST